MYRTLLVPLDGSRFGEHALPWALSIARRLGGALHLVHVHVPAAPLYLGGEMLGDMNVDVTLRKHEQNYLADVLKRVQAVASVPVTAGLLDGGVIESLTHAAQEPRADLIVITTHGRGAFSRFWLGSVADQLMRQSPVPLLLVRPHEGEPNLAAEEGSRHILIPLDGTPLAEKILEPAVALGSLVGADYTLLQVIEPPSPIDYVGVEGYVGSFGQAMIQRLEEMEKKVRADAESYLERVAERMRARALRVQTRVVSHAQPSVAILEEARSSNTDLIALETHGRTGLARLFVGSVADKVVRSAMLPVLVHRATAAVKNPATVELPAREPVPEHPGCFHGQSVPANASVS